MKKRYMPHGCLYLNQSGDRWICEDMRFVLLGDGKSKVRMADFYESFGNSASVYFRYKGKRMRAMFEDFTRVKGLPVVILKRWKNAPCNNK